MSRDKRYQKLMNARRWWEVKAIVKQRAGGDCEQCKQEGRVVPGVDCHHIRPVEAARTYDGPDGMVARCYDPENVRLLCVACHKEAHRQLRSQSKQAHLDAEANRTDDWLSRHIRHDTTDT